MKISKLLKMLLGATFFRMGVVEDGGGSSEPLNAHSAADAFSSLLGDGSPEEKESQADDSPEAAAERLAKQEAETAVGTEGEPNPGEGDPDPAVDDVTVEIDGKTVKLTKTQIAENYKDGLRQADYTRKTMETAEARKTAEAETSRARQERDTYAQKLNTFAISTYAAIQEQEALLTDELLTNSPLEYLAIERTVKQRQANLVKAQQEMQNIDQQQQTERAAAQKAYFAEQQQQLLAKLPEWNDAAKATAEVAAMKDYLGKKGFTAEESVFPDHRLVLLARDAMRYHDLMERAKGAVKKVATLPTKVERAGSAEVSKPDGRTEAMKRLERTGSIDAAANAFSQFMK